MAPPPRARRYGIANLLASIVPRRFTRIVASQTSVRICSTTPSRVLDMRVSAALLQRMSRPPKFADGKLDQLIDRRLIADVRLNRVRD